MTQEQKLPKPTSLLFDWDGTLNNSLALFNKGHNAARAHFGMPPIDLKTTKEASAQGPSGAMAYALDGRDDLAEEGLQIYRSYIRENQITHLGTVENGFPGLMPGAFDLILTAHKLGIPMAIVTNKDLGILRTEIEHLGWQNMFKAFIGPYPKQESHKNKPAADPAFNALEILKLAPSASVWFIGDTEADVGCGYNAGLSTILIGSDDYLHMPKPHLQLGSCIDVLKLLDSLYLKPGIVPITQKLKI